MAKTWLVDWINKWMCVPCDLQLHWLNYVPCLIAPSMGPPFSMKYASVCLSWGMCTNARGCFGKDSSQLWALRINHISNSSQISFITALWVQCQPTKLGPGTCLLCVSHCQRLGLQPSILFSFVYRWFTGQSTDLGTGKPGFKKCPYHLLFEWPWEVLTISFLSFLV